MVDWYQTLYALCKDMEPLITAVVHPVDVPSLSGAVAADRAGIIKAILVGPEARIQAAAKSANLDISNCELVNTNHSEDSIEKAVNLVKTGKAEALMKGEIHTDELMHIVVKKESGLRTARRMSHVFVVEVPFYSKTLFITDAALNIFPDLAAKKDIVQNAIDLFAALGLGKPKVALVSATENVMSSIPSTLDATALCKMSDREQITGGILDGPLSFDLAISKESVQIKGIKSPVAGDADIIVTPDLESGNILYKQMAFLSKAESAGIILGANVPIVLTSRSNDVESRKASCAMALLYARSKVKR